MSAGGIEGAQHRRGHSTGSSAMAVVGKEREEDLALFHEMKARERIHFLHPSTEEDIEASLRYRMVATAPPLQHKSPNDLLGLEPEKNDYDWLLTPPGTPLFPSLDRDLPSEAQLEAASVRATTRSRPSRISRGSSSPSRRPSSPSPSSTSSLSRRPSFGNSSPSRPGSSSSRPVTPTGARPSTPGRSSTPTRRTLTTSASFNKITTTSNNVGRTARSSSPSSRKPRTPVHPAMPAGFASEPPPNLRTSMPDRPSSSNTRGASLSPRLVGGGSSSFKSSDHRRAVSPSFSRSYSSSASSSKGSVVSSSQNSGIEVNRPSPRVVITTTTTDSGGKRPISGCEETSPVKPVTKKPVRTGGTGSFSAINSQRKPFDTSSSRQMDFRRNSSGGFRPLMSNSHISSFYTRASNSLQQRSMTDSSINSSSAASVEHDQDEEVASRLSRDDRDEFASLDAMIDDRKAEELLEDHSLELARSCEETRALEIVEELEPMVEQARAQTQAQVEEEMVIEKSDHHELLVLTPTSSDHSPPFQDEVDMEIDESHPLDEDTAASMRSLLELVISKAVDLAENQERQSARAPHPSSKVSGGAVKPDEAQQEQNSSPPSSTKDPSLHCFTQLIDLKYSSSSLEVYQFDQELHTTGSEVLGLANDPAPKPRDCRSSISPSTSTTTISDKKASTSSSSASQLSETFATRSSNDRGDHPKTSSTNTDVHRLSSRITTKPRDPPNFGAFLSASRHYKRRDSRESSLFSIQISSSKGGESISSGGRPASTTDDSVDDITPRRIHHLDLACNGDASSNGTYTYKASDEYDTKSEESCVDYYIDSMDPPQKFVDKTTTERGGRTTSLNSSKECEILASEDVLPGGFDNDEDGYVDYYIDDFSSRQKMAGSDDREFSEPAAKKSIAAIASHRQDAMDIVLEEERSLLVDDTHIEVCSMEESSSSECGDHHPGGSAEDPRDRGDEEIDTMTECWKQLEEAEQHHQHHEKLPGSINGAGSTTNTIAISSSESTRESILFCSSIVHDLVYRAASLGIEKEDLKAASADELVTFLGLSKTHHIPPKFVDLDPTKWKASEESTVRRTLTYLQNQKLMPKTTVAFMHSPPLGRVEEDVKDHIIPEHHFIDRSLERGGDAASAESLRRRSKSKCRCVIL
ncbi:uncharacterized protein LOC112348475 [Selaginella moellendorffii]|uniref:uncharacterized protein LOC112348475 n=1 Tax=Selaginella moellendorffii TaxID=88036 RepID=UPI000D1C9CD1|nr:uncharacterized protein LOC112348475 [Selaginella moellendorffii]|eukprot:XP_024536833.1 uncharacterized protein LOC112348475 [Selaginella moellendorffii]